MSDPFKNYTLSADSAAIGALAITPSDSTDLDKFIRAITIGGNGGTLSFVSSRDGQTYTTAHLPAGTYALFVSRLRATGTTATSLTGWI